MSRMETQQNRKRFQVFGNENIFLSLLQELFSRDERVTTDEKFHSLLSLNINTQFGRLF